MTIQRLFVLTLAIFACLGIYRGAAAHGDNPLLPPDQLPPVEVNGAGVYAACAGGPVIDGITLDECITRNFTVGGTGKSIRVWYTKGRGTR